MQGMEGFFIDKLNVYQDHHLSAADFPILGEVKHYRVDTVTGDSKDISKFVGLEGSYSSYLSIKVNGSRVEVYGNPSRWGRIDNLFGLATLDECLAVYNGVLLSLGLPPFTKCTQYIHYSGKDGHSVNKTADGAIIRHIDFTRNMAVGKGNERPFLKGLSTQSINRSISPFLYPDENTVEWYGKNAQKNGSRYRYVKVYNKTSDLLRHLRERTNNQSHADINYYNDLVQFTASHGVVREEHSFKSMYLKEKSLFAWGLFNEQAFHDELQTITNIRKHLSVANMKFQTIADQLLEQGVCKSTQSANATAMYYNLWLHGEYFDKTKRQYFEHRKRLLNLGIDIGVKLDISRAPIRLKECQEIEVKPLAIPDFYRMPTTIAHAHLRLVA